MKYTKPPLSISDQIKLLESRGLIITDKANAEKYLSNISYYRLSAYMYPFKNLDTDEFAKGTLFESDKTTFKERSLDMASRGTIQAHNPTGFGVAGCALDARNGRLYFAPMHFSEISFLDLNKTETNFTAVNFNRLLS